MSNRFVFIACHYNMSETIAQMLHSIAGQSYKNWKVVITDDVSSGEFEFMDASTIADHHFAFGGYDIKFKYNTEKRWETLNVLNMIREETNDDDIICRIDCDDWLCDLDALYMLNECYERTGADVVWSGHRWGFSDKNISGELPATANPYTHPWVTSHLKTFRKSLLNDVNEENFKNQNGEYVRRCGDQAIYLPVLYKAKKRIFLPRALYHYSINDVPETYQTDDAKFQKEEADFIRARGFVK